MYIVLLSVLCLLSLFILYMLSKNDFVFLRKNISLESVFNTVLFCGGSALIFGRLFSLIDSARAFIWDPFILLHVVKVPGFSFFGAIGGGVLVVSVLVKEKEALLRMYDIFIISFLPVLFFGSLLQIRVMSHWVFFLLLTVLFSFLFAFVVRVHRNYMVKDGSILLAVLIAFSFLEVVSGTFEPTRKFMLHLSARQFVATVSFFICSVLLVKNESIAQFWRKRR